MKYVPNYQNMDDLFPHHKIPDIEFPKHEGEKSLFELIESQSAYLEKTSNELHDMAESAKLQAELATKQSDSAKEEAKLSNRYAKISNENIGMNNSFMFFLLSKKLNILNFKGKKIILDITF